MFPFSSLLEELMGDHTLITVQPFKALDLLLAC